MAFLVLIPVSASSPWTPIAEKVKQSVVFLENCTGFVIDQQRHYILTAAHCLPEDETKILVDGEKAYRVYLDNRKDLLVLRAPGVDKPALRLSPDRMQLAEEVMSVGYGFAWEAPMVRMAHLSQSKLEQEDLGSGPFIVIDEVLVPGQSGGPIVNIKGEVVAIVQMTIPGYGVGIGRDAETIKDRAGRYFEEKP
jgi:S1-C subfamily serine protease